jgi:transposase
MFSIASTGRQWRQLPKEFPPYSTVRLTFSDARVTCVAYYLCAAQ